MSNLCVCCKCKQRFLITVKEWEQQFGKGSAKTFLCLECSHTPDTHTWDDDEYQKLSD